MHSNSRYFDQQLAELGQKQEARFDCEMRAIDLWREQIMKRIKIQQAQLDVILLSAKESVLRKLDNLDEIKLENRGKQAHTSEDAERGQETLVDEETKIKHLIELECLQGRTSNHQTTYRTVADRLGNAKKYLKVRKP